MCKKYHCSYYTIKDILSLHNIKLGKTFNRCKLTENDCKNAFLLYTQGMSTKDIAERFHVDKTTIYSMFKKYGFDYHTV